jgi:hypothetical protein
MHQQVRTSTKKTGSGSPGPGAMADEGSLVDILQQLREGGVNLQAAGGRDLDGDGEFVFAVHHGTELVGGPAQEAADLLNKLGYDARVVDVHHCVVSDRTGGLLECLEKIEGSGDEAYEIFVGTRGEYDGIPIQITTRASVKGKAAY